MKESYTKQKFGIDLERKENWTPLLTYIHRSRFMAGLIFGGIIGTLTVFVILNILKD